MFKFKMKNEKSKNMSEIEKKTKIKEMRLFFLERSGNKWIVNEVKPLSKHDTKATITKINSSKLVWI